jgi:hypothetical protein
MNFLTIFNMGYFMRLNYFQYHVQDRNYTKAEVFHLINNESYKHHLLSGNQHFYSLGTVSEIFQATTSIFSSIIKYAFKTNDPAQAINNNSTNATQIDIHDQPAGNVQYTYTGREVAAFLNKYYDYSHVFSFNSKTHYNNIINQFLEHRYLDEDVPTLGDSSILDIAALDIYA